MAIVTRLVFTLSLMVLHLWVAVSSQQPPCLTQTLRCGEVFSNASAAESFDDVCGASSPLKLCADDLRKECTDLNNPFEVSGIKLLQFFDYICSEKGQREVIAWEVCENHDKCKKDPRAPTKQSCTGAQLYVNCINSACGPLAAEYALMQEGFEIEVQGGTCGLRVPNATVTTCLDQSQMCLNLFVQARYAGSIDEVCGQSAALKSCVDTLKDRCVEEIDPGHWVSVLMIDYLQYLCSPSGKADIIEFGLCDAMTKCGKMDRTNSPESCREAQMYVNCTLAQCGHGPAEYARHNEQFEIEVQGGTCQFQGSNATPKNITCLKQIEMCGTALASAGSESVTTPAEVCGPAAPLTLCLNGIQARCRSTDVGYSIANKMAMFLQYTCSQKGLAEATYWSLCDPIGHCNKTSRTATIESCAAAQAYVNCTYDKCGTSAASYALTSDTFEIEVQGGVCKLEEPAGAVRVQNLTCTEQTLVCIALLASITPTTPLSDICGTTGPLPMCVGMLQDKCKDPTDPAHLPANLTVYFHQYICSKRGQSGATFMTACKAEAKCGKVLRSATNESCSAAKTYVKCVKEKCGSHAAGYAVTREKFEIEVQAGACDLQVPNDTVSVNGPSCGGQAEICGTLLGYTGTANTLEEICGDSSALKICMDSLDDKCGNEPVPHQQIGKRMVKFHRYICSDKGQREAGAFVTCAAQTECTKQPRTTTPASCSDAQSYVNCVTAKCGENAANYTLVIDKFEIEVQGGSCELQVLAAPTTTETPTETSAATWNRGTSAVVLLISFLIASFK